MNVIIAIIHKCFRPGIVYALLMVNGKTMWITTEFEFHGNECGDNNQDNDDHVGSR